MNMNNFRSTIRISLAGAGLATLIACGGSGPDPQPQPKPTLNSTVSLKAQNLDNPGSTEYMSGDRIEYTANAAVSVSNPSAGMEPASIFRVEYTMYPGQNFDMVLSGNDLPNFNDTRVNTVGIVGGTATAPLQYRVTVNDPTVESKSTTLTGNGDTVTFKPSIRNNYTRTQIGDSILSNLDKVVEVSSRFTSSSNLIPSEWRALYQYCITNQTAISFDVDFIQNRMRIYFTNGTSFTADGARPDVYSLQKEWTKTMPTSRQAYEVAYGSDQ